MDEWFDLDEMVSLKDFFQLCECKILSNERPKIEFHNIYEEHIGKIKVIYERFKQNMIKRENDSMNETRNFHVTNVPLFSQQAVKKIVMDNKQIIKKIS